MIVSNYISAKGGQNLKQFKYNGVCDSILYEYILSDFAQFIVNKMPYNLAPNVITLTGFGFLITSTVIHLVMNPSLNQDLPRWVYFFTAASMFIYQTLDNCDGKQARRTKSSTALGMLIDHGADCVAAMLIGLQIISSFRIGEGIPSAFGWSYAACLSFFSGIHSQKYTGLLKLNRINGVDEGLPFLEILFFVTGIIGSNFWLQEPIQGISNQNFLLFCLYLGTTVEVVGFGKQTLKFFKTIPQFLLSIMPAIQYESTLIIISIFAPQYFNNHLILSLLIMLFQWSKMVNLLQLSLITKEKSNRPNYSWHIIQGMFSLSAIFHSQLEIFIDSKNFLILLVLASFFTYIKCIYCLITEMCQILEIKLLKINPK